MSNKENLLPDYDYDKDVSNSKKNKSKENTIDSSSMKKLKSNKNALSSQYQPSSDELEDISDITNNKSQQQNKKLYSDDEDGDKTLRQMRTIESDDF